jgi:Skp family chaperone for outer membrane proteins
MKKVMLTFLACLLVLLFAAPGAMAQSEANPAQSTDVEVLEQKIAALEKRAAELSRRRRQAELQKKLRDMQELVSRLERGEDAAQPSPATPLPSVERVAATTRPESATTAGAGTLAPGASTDSTSAAPAAPAPAAPAQDAPATGTCREITLGVSKPSRFDQAICFLARAIVNNKALDLSSEAETFLLPTLLGQLARSNKVVLDAETQAFVLEAENKRTDKQIGADPKSAGTTSLVVKGGMPAVLGWAVENGAAVASRDGTTYTFRFNPVGVVEALSGQGYISAYQKAEDDPFVNGFLRNTSLGFSFDTTRGTDPPTLIGSKQQLSAVSVRYQFVNERDPRHRRWKSVWDRFFQTAGLRITEEQSVQLRALEAPRPTDQEIQAAINNPALLAQINRRRFKNESLQKWVEDLDKAYQDRKSELTAMDAAAQTEVVRGIIEQHLATLPVEEMEQDPVAIQALKGFVTAHREYVAERNRILEGINKGTVIAFEYTNHREVNAPDLSNFRFIAERGTIGGLDFTGNASVTIFNKRPADLDAKRLKDFSFALQLDKKLNDLMGLGDGMFSFAGKFERVMSNAEALDGTVLPNTKGDIAAGQVKLTIPLGETGIKLPFSVTFANRTELVREKEVRGNFGFTLDFDTLFARFKPFAK